MMKFIMIYLFISFMLMEGNLMVMFYYNLSFLMSLIFLCSYISKSDLLFSNLMLYMGMDNYSFMLILLSMWVIGLMYMSLDLNEKNLMSKLLIFNLMGLMLINFFMSMNLMLFYIFFELILIPTFFLIVYWGSNPERISASFYMIMYMLVFSLPLLYYIFWMFKFSYSMNFKIMEYYFNSNFLSLWGLMIIFSVFFVKLPIYLFHIWLPKAHVEAPVYGSMVLAAILLKLGSYGLLRLLIILLNKSLKYSFMILSLSMMGSVFVGMLCLLQIDMKSLVAYSSVVHMNLMLSALMTMCKLGFLSAYIMMISHGLCSSGLFYMVNLYYKWSLSRLMILNKGMINIFSSLSLWWFLLCVANFSFPLSLNFISEIFMISVIMNWDLILIIYLMMICFISSVYSLYLYSYIQHGSGFMSANKSNMISFIKEFMVILLHIYPLILILINLIMFF